MERKLPYCPPELLKRKTGREAQLPPPELLERPAWMPATGPPGRQFPPLEAVTSPTVDSVAAAHYLNRRPQTLRAWACHEDGPIRPIRINGRLAWSVPLLRRLLGVA
jgi:hypothetical protein